MYESLRFSCKLVHTEGLRHILMAVASAIYPTDSACLGNVFVWVLLLQVCLSRNSFLLCQARYLWKGEIFLT